VTPIIAVGIATALSATAYADVITTGSVLQTATKAIAQQTSAHVVFVAHASSSSTTEKIIADVGLAGGSETLSEGKAYLAIRVTSTFAYVSGSSSGLTTLFGLTSAQAKKLGTDWESWKPGTKQYASLKADLTMSSVTALLPKVKGTRLSGDATNGSKLYVLKWTSAATNSIPKLSHTLTLSTMGATLPIEVTETSSTGVKVKTELSKWDENFSVLEPPVASTIASSKISG
jgi:hypothetical protein